MDAKSNLFEETLHVVDTIKKIEKIGKSLDEFASKIGNEVALIQDADTILADLIEQKGHRYPGIAQDIFEIWTQSSDKRSVEQMFYELVGIEFNDYLDKCITDTCYELLPDKIVKGTFVSVWDGGIKISSNCKVNLNTKEVFEIEVVDGATEFVSTLDEEYIVVDGVKHAVSNSILSEGFWHR